MNRKDAESLRRPGCSTAESSRGAACLMAWAFLLLALPVRGQVVRGSVLDAESGLSMAGVTVALLDTAANVVRVGVTGDNGVFALAAPAQGRYRLLAERLGAETVRTDQITVGAEVVEVVIRLGVKPVELDRLTVVARRKRESLAERDMRLLRERILEYPHYVGRRILTRAELERTPGFTLSDVLRQRPGRSCLPKLYVNGMLRNRGMIDGGMSIQNIEAVEFYTGYWVPGRARFVDVNGCGVTLVWTRR